MFPITRVKQGTLHTIPFDLEQSGVALCANSGKKCVIMNRIVCGVPAQPFEWRGHAGTPYTIDWTEPPGDVAYGD